MKKMNKKGFTIVELSIVIAVIAILSAVLIPTFTSIVKNSKNSAAIQDAQNAYTQYIADANLEDEELATDAIYKTSDGKYIALDAGKAKVDNKGVVYYYDSVDDAIEALGYTLDDTTTTDINEATYTTGTEKNNITPVFAN